MRYAYNMTIHYFRDGGGYIAVDTSQRVQQAPGFLYGRCAARTGDLRTICDRVWSPTALKNEVESDEVPSDWRESLGFESTTPVGRSKGRSKGRSRQQPVWDERPNQLPEKSYLVPLMPLAEYEAFLNRDCEVEPVKHRMINMGFPWETSTGSALMTTLVCILLGCLCIGLL